MDEPTSNTPPAGSAALLPVVYDELRKLARAMMAAENGPQTLTATALVHEAWLRVSKDDVAKWENRRHFFGAELGKVVVLFAEVSVADVGSAGLGVDFGAEGFALAGFAGGDLDAGWGVF